MRLITFITDFGNRDSYVAEMKAALLRVAPRAVVIDITHEIPPQDVAAASFTLGRALQAFGRGTIHVAVVDPDVGTDRRLLAVRIAGQTVLCPDNGLITWSWRMHAGAHAHACHWKPTARVGSTFDGRDRFAPIAGRLAIGRSLKFLATKIDDPILLPLKFAEAAAESGEIIHIDHFGNAVTNLLRTRLEKDVVISVGRRSIGPIRSAYADVSPGEPLAVIGSCGLLEIAVRNGSAAALLKLRRGDQVRISHRRR